MTSTSDKKIRYGVIGAGWISQSAFMPAIAHTGNSVMTALVTGDMKKAHALAKQYNIEHVCDYDGYAQLLKAGTVDALYIGLPNELHAEYTIPALEKGIHVLLEKPMAISEEECKKISAAAVRGNAKLMVAYRLHFEPATLAAIARVRNGEIGDPRFFSAVMGQKVDHSNHRAKQGYWAGPVADMGPYPINAVRNLFGDEPIEVMAMGAKNPALGFNFHDTVTVILRFPNERLAQFTVSYSSTQVDVYRVIGTEADLEVTPGFNWGKPIEHRLTRDGKTEKKEFEQTDHFGGETRYFSECILHDALPEPDGEEGLADVRIIAAIERALETGKPQQLAPFTRHQRPQIGQVIQLPPIKEPKMIDAAQPSDKQQWPAGDARRDVSASGRRQGT